MNLEPTVSSGNTYDTEYRTWKKKVALVGAIAAGYIGIAALVSYGNSRDNLKVYSQVNEIVKKAGFDGMENIATKSENTSISVNSYTGNLVLNNCSFNNTEVLAAVDGATVTKIVDMSFATSGKSFLTSTESGVTIHFRNASELQNSLPNLNCQQ